MGLLPWNKYRRDYDIFGPVAPASGSMIFNRENCQFERLHCEPPRATPSASPGAPMRQIDHKIFTQMSSQQSRQLLGRDYDISKGLNLPPLKDALPTSKTLAEASITDLVKFAKVPTGARYGSQPDHRWFVVKKATKTTDLLNLKTHQVLQVDNREVVAALSETDFTEETT